MWHGTPSRLVIINRMKAGFEIELTSTFGHAHFVQPILTWRVHITCHLLNKLNKKNFLLTDLSKRRDVKNK